MKILPAIENKNTLLAFARLRSHDDWPHVRKHLEKATYAALLRKFMEAHDAVAVAHRTQVALNIVGDLMELFDTAYQKWEAWDQKEKAGTINKGIPLG